MKKFILITALHASLFTLHVTEAQIIHVPADQPTIQAGITAASAGDTVLVAEGTYYENINFWGKAITVASHFILYGDTNHVNNTMIDGGQNGPVVTFITGEDTTSVICGFTITGGSGMYDPIHLAMVGGGIVCYYATAKIIHNKIIDNVVSDDNYAWGAGIASIRESGSDWTVVENNVIRNNQSLCLNGGSTGNVATGGGIEIWGNARIANNIIENNVSHCVTGMAGGGGIAIESVNDPPDTLKLMNNIIRNNLAHSDNVYAPGGGVFIINSICLISNNTIKYNQCDGYTEAFGGGVVAQYADVTMINNSINYNSVNANKSYGGGVSLWYSGSLIQNTEICNNSVSAIEADGGGLHFFHPETIKFMDNKVNYNASITDSISWGGGIACFYPEAACLFLRNEFIGNSSPMYKVPPQPIFTGAGGGIVVLNALMNEVIADRNYFSEDTSKTGGGFYARDCYNLKLTNNIFFKNVSYRGGGIVLANLQTSGPDNHAMVANNTLVENSSPNMGGGLWYTGNINAPIIFNCIFHNNTAPSGPDIRNLSTQDLVVSNSLIDTNNILGNWEGEGNIFADPEFLTGDTLFHLSDSSPAIDQGVEFINVNGTEYYAPLEDFEGEPRPYYVSWDIGADEFFIDDVNEYSKQHPILKTYNYPNPFCDQTSIIFNLSEQARVLITIYDLLGREIKKIELGEIERGEHNYILDSEGLGSGIYLYNVSAGNASATRKLVLQKF